MFSREAFLDELTTHKLLDLEQLEDPTTWMKKKNKEWKTEDRSRDYFEPIDEADKNPETAPTAKIKLSYKRRFLALCTINGRLEGQPSFLQRTMRVVSCLEADERMPVICCGEQLARNTYERWAKDARRADSRALGCQYH